MQEAQIRTIFGLKLRQLRDDRHLSLYALAKKTGLSKSYLNEIEKGKKYPKTDKVLALANGLGVEYDELVSLKFSGRMAPVADMITSGMLGGGALAPILGLRSSSSSI
ncbi:MAG: helix-turn-helix transcriptional regulator [Owenweeksia sp.]|nr:helix-turn-helix transcriptional regulator [Owenweeksia sp.]